jgi:hypothetical protein
VGEEQCGEDARAGGGGVGGRALLYNNNISYRAAAFCIELLLLLQNFYFNFYKLQITNYKNFFLQYTTVRNVFTIYFFTFLRIHCDTAISYRYFVSVPLKIFDAAEILSRRPPHHFPRRCHCR